jgi:hypothetical protein
MPRARHVDTKTKYKLQVYRYRVKLMSATGLFADCTLQNAVVSLFNWPLLFLSTAVYIPPFITGALASSPGRPHNFIYLLFCFVGAVEVFGNISSTMPYGKIRLVGCKVEWNATYRASVAHRQGWAPQAQRQLGELPRLGAFVKP